MEKKRFTQEELEQAFQQIIEERQVEWERADKAAKWVKGQLGVDSVRPSTGLSWPHGQQLSPKPENPFLACSRPSKKKTWEKEILKHSWIQRTDQKAWYGDGNFYEAETPYGTYRLNFCT